jgi:hypothetical protein
MLAPKAKLTTHRRAEHHTKGTGEHAAVKSSIFVDRKKLAGRAKKANHGKHAVAG